MSSNSGIFGLSGFNDKNLEGLIPDKTRESYREYGYFAGGITHSSRIDRIDYSNDTTIASIRGPLVATTYGAGSTGNENFGYIASGGAQGASIQTRVQRINYSNDTSTSHRTNLSTGRGRVFGATSNKNYGYFGGGRKNAIGTTIIDRLDYSNDLLNASRIGNFSRAKGEGSAAGNSDFGWYKAGNQTDRIDYSNDFSSPLERANFVNGGSLSQATGNSNFGYFVRGYEGGGLGPTTNVYRLDYSNDLNTIPIRFNLSIPMTSVSATGNSNFGYFHLSDASSVSYSIVNRCDYSNDTATPSVRGAVSSSRSITSATSSASFGGSPISQYGVFAKPFGYFGGGLVPGTISTIDRIDYSSDTSLSLVRNNLNQGRNGLSATGNSNFGYFGGGTTSGPGTIGELSIVDRIDYSNDSVSLSPKGSLSLSRHYSAATGNSNFGYFSGGVVSSPSFSSVSTIDRINYSNDTSTALARGPLSSARYVIAATGTFNFGYFGGGASGPLSTIDRINYSNDTSTTSVRGPLGLGRTNLSATGNQNFGYFGGGNPGPVSTVDRIDYSNDTTTASVIGSLSLVRHNLSATGNSNFGYFGGGNPGPVSTVDRIDYSNDTATASVRGPLSSIKQRLSATSPTAFGGATDFTPTQTFFDIQSMRRIEDTTNYSVKKRALGSFGYFGGGILGNTDRSYLNRIDFSNDTAIASSRSGLISADLSGCAIANSNFGYFKSGRTSIISKIDMSNDSSSHRSITTGILQGNVVGNKNTSIFCSLLTSVLYRLDYSNDTSFTSRGFIRSRGDYMRSSQIATNEHGYFLGHGGGTPSYSKIQRISYSNDNVNALLRGNLLYSRSYTNGGTGNSNYGYIGGDLSAAGRTSFDRIDYSNDTANSTIRSNGHNTWANAALSNENFGYWGGGGAAPQQVVRLNYANDTSNVSTRGNLINGFVYFAGFTNARTS